MRAPLFMLNTLLIPETSQIQGKGQSPVPEDPGLTSDSGLLDAYSRAVTGVVETVGPSVVSVHIRKPVPGDGSGVIFTPDGFILTNHHVISKAEEIEVTLLDGRSVQASLIGSDPSTDLGILRISLPEIVPAELGSSDTLRVGQLVIALGNPFGLSNTVSTGVISALERSIRGPSGHLIASVIQSDAAINPGNSGGPLTDSSGRVIGINTAMIQRAQGIGFAIPVNTARFVLTEILNHGRVRRIQLGIMAANRPITPHIKHAMGLETSSLIEILRLEKNSIADKAGLKPRDCIYSIKGTSVGTIDDLHLALSEVARREELEIGIISGGRKIIKRMRKK